MKKLPLLSIIILIVFSACTNFGNTEKQAVEKKKPLVTLMATQLADSMAMQNELEVLIAGTITDVCRMSGCWLELDMGNGNRVLITFPEEVFVVDTNAIGKQATVTGTASKVIVPVNRLRLQAADEGESEEMVNAINEPITEYSIAATKVSLN